jgi:hypothetical protein
VIAFKQCGGVHICCGLPRIVTVWVTLPLDQVLELALTPGVTVIDDGLHLEFLLTLDEIRWQSREVGAVGFRLDIGS